MLGVCPLLAAATITYTIQGTLGPVLSGTDPLKANGKSGKVTAVIGTLATPISRTSTSATYALATGAVTVVIGGSTYKNQAGSTLKYTFPATGPDTMVFTATIKVNTFPATVKGTVYLAPKSFPSTVATHPAKFTPSPQKLTAAKVAGGVGSQVKYSSSLIGTTVLGLTGTASN